MEQTARETMEKIVTEILDPIIALLFAGALVYFVYGVVVFIAKADDETERERGKKHLLYSVLGFVIMVGVYGLLRLLTGTLGVDDAPGLAPL